MSDFSEMRAQMFRSILDNQEENKKLAELYNELENFFSETGLIDNAPTPGLQRVGICSLCGGDVMGWRGPWWSVSPPPMDECSQCGAHRRDNVIDMVRPGIPGPKPNDTGHDKWVLNGDKIPTTKE